MITKLLNEVNEKIEKLNNLVQDKEYFKKLEERIEKVNNYAQEQKQEIERLNNIINEFNKLIENEINESKLEEDYDRVDVMEYCLATLREIKGEDKE